MCRFFRRFLAPKILNIFFLNFISFSNFKKKIKQICQTNFYFFFFQFFSPSSFFFNFFMFLIMTAKTFFPLRRTSQKFKPNPNEIFLRSKNILAWVRFEFLGNQAFIRGCGGEAPARVSEQNLVRLGQVVRSI